MEQKNNKIQIQYFQLYAADFLLYKSLLSNEEIIDVIEAISINCLFNREKTFKNEYQNAFYEKLKLSVEKNKKSYKNSIENGKKGGRPKKSDNQEETHKKPTGFLKQNPEKTHSETNIIEYNKIENNIIKEKKIDPYCNKYLDLTLNLSEKHLGYRPRLSSIEVLKIVELVEENKDYEDIIEQVIISLKNIKWENIDFKPSLNWLLKETNFYRLLNGEFDKKEEKGANGWTLV